MKNYETKTYKEALEKAKAYDEALVKLKNPLFLNMKIKHVKKMIIL